MPTTHQSRRRFASVHVLLLFAGAGFTSALLVWWMTAEGVGVSPDSIVYIEAVKDVLTGRGLSVGGAPMTHYPPLYPLLLAGVALFQPDVLEAARWLHAILFGVNVVLLGAVIRLSTHGDLWAAACGVLSAFTAPVISVHVMAWSESPFIALALTSLILFSLHIARPRPHLLYGASVALGLAVITRYVGVTLLPPVLVGILFLGNRSAGSRVRDAVVAVCLSCAPLAAWFIRNMLIAQTLANRDEIAVHWVTAQHIKNLVGALHLFVVPVNIPAWGKALEFGLLGGLFMWGLFVLHRHDHFRRNRSSVSLILPLLCLLFAFTYILFLFATVSFIDAWTPLDYRLLAPFLWALVVVSISVAWSVAEASGNRRIWSAFVLGVLLVFAFNVPRTARRAADLHEHGIAFASRAWRDSPTMQWVQSLPDGQPLHIFSNGPDVVRFRTGRAAGYPPVLWSRRTLRPNLVYENEMRLLRQEVNEGKAVVVYFDGIDFRPFLPGKKELDLPLARELSDGAVFANRSLLEAAIP